MCVNGFLSKEAFSEPRPVLIEYSAQRVISEVEWECREALEDRPSSSQSVQETQIEDEEQLILPFGLLLSINAL